MSTSAAANSGSRSPIAGGEPISDAVADRASEWLTVMLSGTASDDERDRWLRWRSAHPDHERAWQHIESVIGKIKVMSPRAAYQALSPYGDRPRSVGRRKGLRTLMWAGGALGGAGMIASRTETWQQWAADFRTATGQQRKLTLDDGTAVTLNTATALDVRFDDRQRLVRLVTGELMVVTARAVGDRRPFVVETAEGRIRALGTRFTVRRTGNGTSVAVLESAVEITPHDGAKAFLLHSGERASFTRRATGRPEVIAAQDDAWASGQLVASEIRLADFVAELNRYRPGLVRCAPEVADLRFSGVFPLANTDHILSSLPRVLPVRVTSRTRYWVTVEAAAQGSGK